MKQSISILLAAFLLFFLTGEVAAQNARQMVRKGNKLYEEEKYTEAEVQYLKSLDTDQNSFEGKFNLADAMIRQEKYDQAVEQLQILAGTTTNKADLAKVYHNMGNALIQKKELEKSIEAYKNSLRNNPADDETRYNLAYAQNLLKEQQQQEQNHDQNQDQQDQDKKDQQDKQDQKDQQDQQDKKDQEQKDQQQNQDQQKQEEQDQQQPEPNPNEMSKENAEQILQSLQQDEREVKEKVDEQKKVKARSKRVDKEW